MVTETPSQEAFGVRASGNTHSWSMCDIHKGQTVVKLCLPSFRESHSSPLSSSVTSTENKLVTKCSHGHRVGGGAKVVGELLSSGQICKDGEAGVRQR